MRLSNYNLLGECCKLFGDFSLVTIREQDIESIRIWRNSQMDILRQAELISKEQQVDYFRNVVFPQFESARPAMILFSYLLRGECIGYGGLVHIDWSAMDAEISFLLNTDICKNVKLHKAYFCAFMKLLEGVAFGELNFLKIHTEAYDVRPWHIEAIESCGFKFLKRIPETTIVNGNSVDSIVHYKTKEMAG